MAGDRIRAPVEELAQEEAPFDRVRRRVGVWLGPLLCAGLLLAPLPLEPRAHALAALMALVIVYWITEPLPLAVTAFLGPALAVVFGVAPARKALEGFADPVIFLFLGSFLLAEALHVHGLDRRIALGLLALPGVASSPARIRIAVALATAGISMWISNTATAAMMVPIGLGLVRALSAAGSTDPPRATLLLIGMAASLGGIATPVGTPPNLVAMGFLDQAGHGLGFLQFMAVGVPLSLVLTGVSIAVASRLLPGAPRVERAAEWVAAERAAMGKWAPGQRACAIAFGAAILLWVLPGVVSFTGTGGGLARWLGDRLEESVVALLCAGLLFLWPVPSAGGAEAAPRRRALEWRDATRIDWGTLLLFGGGLSLGRLAFDTGLADVLGRGVVNATGVDGLWGLTALMLAVSIVLTETVSNTATVSMLAPLALALARQLGVPLEPPLLAVAFGASMGFMFPVGTPPNAIVYGTGLVPLTAMMRMGVIVDVLSFIIIFLGLRLLCPLLGLA
jgi:solute carrier family 13 (sodium-dependent dicarboxylate transporter), member 2/3/5